MSLRNVAEEMKGMNPLEHLIRQNWQPGAENMVLAELNDNNFVKEFVRSLFKKEETEISKLEVDEPNEAEILQYMQASGSTREDAILKIKFQRVGEKIDLNNFDISEDDGIFPGQDKVSKYFYHPDKNSENIKDPSFTMEVLTNISSATQDLVKRALDNDFNLMLLVESEHYNTVASNSESFGAPPIWVGETYQASGKLKIFL